jgi:hypothetical protein
MTQPSMSPLPTSQTPDTLYDIRWNEVCPPLILIRALRVSVMVRVLGLALVGVVLTGWGWSWMDQLFPSGAAHLTPLTQRLSATRGGEVRWLAGPMQLLESSATDLSPARDSAAGSAMELKLLPALSARPLENVSSVDLPARKVVELGAHKPFPRAPRLVDRAVGWVDWGDPLTCAWSWLSEPLVRSAGFASGWRQSIVLSLGGIWAIIIWALFGGAIARIAALHLTRGETPGPLVALQEAFQKWYALIGAPLIPLIGSALLALPMVLAGLLLRTDFMTLIIGMSWVFVIVWGFVLAILLIGLLIGWPLMWATVSVERTDAFDGVSRCYAYVYQRPLHLMLYIALAIALGWLGQVGVTFFAMAAASLGEWAVSWGAGRERLVALLAPVATVDTPGVESPVAEGLSGLVASGAAGIRFWKDALELVVASYALAYLWSAAVGIYLLLRRQVDATEMDEVVTEDEDDGSRHGLPPLHADPSGVPGVEPPGAGANGT